MNHRRRALWVLLVVLTVGRVGFGWETGCCVLPVDAVLFVVVTLLVLGRGRSLRRGPWRALLAGVGVTLMAASYLLLLLPWLLAASRICFTFRTEWSYAAPMAEQDPDPRRWPAWAQVRGAGPTPSQDAGPFRVAFPYSFAMDDGELIWSPHGAPSEAEDAKHSRHLRGGWYDRGR